MGVLDEVLRRHAWGSVSGHHQAVVAAYSSSAWVQIDGIAGVHQPLKGVPAGVPLADIIFAVIANRVTQSIQRQLLAKGLVSRIGPGEAAHFSAMVEAPWNLILSCARRSRSSTTPLISCLGPRSVSVTASQRP